MSLLEQSLTLHCCGSLYTNSELRAWMLRAAPPLQPLPHTEKQTHHAAEDAIEEVLVWGRASKQIGDAPLVEDDSFAH